MIHTGRVSVTFRNLEAEEIISMVREAGVDGIEWGGDVHVPHGEVSRAVEVARMTGDAGLRVAAYGSYYRLAESEKDGLPFATVLATAVALRAPLIRVWAGSRGSADADEPYRREVEEDARRIVRMAAEAGLAVALEWHGGTLTDSLESASELLRNLPFRHLKTLWQPAPGRSPEACLAELPRILDRLGNLHVYHWDEAGKRQALRAGQSSWRKFFALVNDREEDRFALLEFVRGNQPEAFFEDAKTLKEWVAFSNG